MTDSVKNEISKKDSNKKLTPEASVVVIEDAEQFQTPKVILQFNTYDDNTKTDE